MTDSYLFSLYVRASRENCRVVPTRTAFLLQVALVMLTEAQAGTATGQAVDGTNVQQYAKTVTRQKKYFTALLLLPALLFDLI